MNSKRYYFRSHNKSNNFKSSVEKRSKVKNITTVPLNQNMAKLNTNLDALLQLLPNFEGKPTDNIIFFIKQFDELVQASELEDNIKLILLKSKISGKAKDLFLNLPNLIDSTDYDAFKTALKETFQQTTLVAKSQADFMGLRQQPLQSIEDYVKNFNIHAARYLRDSGLSDSEGAQKLLQNLKLNKFVQSIRPDIAFELRKSGVDTFDKAIQLAKTVELALHESSETLNYIATGAHETETAQQNMQLSQTVSNITDVYSKQIENLQAEVNNLKITAENKTQSENNNAKYCYICNRANSHVTDNCYYNARKFPNGVRGKPITTRNFNQFQQREHIHDFARPQYNDPAFIIPSYPYLPNYPSDYAIENNQQNTNYQTRNNRGQHSGRRGRNRRYPQQRGNNNRTTPVITYAEN